MSLKKQKGRNSLGLTVNEETLLPKGMGDLTKVAVSPDLRESLLQQSANISLVDTTADSSTKVSSHDLSCEGTLPHSNEKQLLTTLQKHLAGGVGGGCGGASVIDVDSIITMQGEGGNKNLA